MPAKSTSRKPVAKSNPPAEPRWWKRGRSSIHQSGLFAADFIPAGTRVIEYVGERLTKRQSAIRALEWIEHAEKEDCGAVYIFELNARHDIDGNVSWNTARLINHSCEPNCETKVIRGRIWILASRDIAPGEELSYDYGYDLEHWQDHPCLCGSSQCIGYIVRKDQRTKLKRLIARKGRNG
jgi:uncharacterized protein